MKKFETTKVIVPKQNSAKQVKADLWFLRQLEIVDRHDHVISDHFASLKLNTSLVLKQVFERERLRLLDW